MDYDEAGALALAYLAEQMVVREPLIRALLATRACLGPFKLVIKDIEIEGLNPDLSLDHPDQPLTDNVSLLFEASAAIVSRKSYFRKQSLKHAHAELSKPARLAILPERDPVRMMKCPRRYRSVGDFDYEVPRVPALDRDMEEAMTSVAAIFEWNEDWEAEWNPTEMELCSRLRMLVVRAFEGDAFLIARRESESADCPGIDDRLKSLEWRESLPQTPRPATKWIPSRDDAPLLPLG